MIAVSLMIIALDFPLKLNEYQLEISDVLVTDSSIFVLDGKSDSLYRYTKASRTLVFDKGQGPRALMSAYHLGEIDGRFYVFCSRKLVFFTANGTFVSSTSFADGAHPLKYGYFARRYEVRGDRDAIVMEWSEDESFDHKVEIHRDGGKILRGDRVFSPAMPSTITTYVEESGLLVFVFAPDQDEVALWDTKVQDFVRRFPLEFNPLPFDQAWGEARYEAFRRRNRVHRGLKRRFPKTFPRVTRLRIDVDGNLIVYRWNPKNHHDVFFYDLDGKRVKSPRFPAQVYDVLLKTDGDHAYVLGFDLEGDCYFVDRIKVQELEGFAIEQAKIAYQQK